MTEAAVLYPHDLENQLGIGLSHSTSDKTQEINPALSWVKKLLTATPVESNLFGAETTFREFFAGALSALPFEGLAGSRFSSIGKGEELASEDIPLVFPSSRDEIAPDAEEYARHLGICGSLLRTQEMVWRVVPRLKCLRIDRYDDPEEEGQSLIRMTIVTSEPVERVVLLDDQLQDIFCAEIPPRHQPYFAFTYQ